MAWSTGVSTSTKPSPSRRRRSELINRLRRVRISRVRSLAHRSTSRWRNRVSTSDTPFHLSPKPRRASASSTHVWTCTDNSPFRVRTIFPPAPTQSPSDNLENASNSAVIFSKANSCT